MDDVASVIAALERASTPEAHAALASRGIPERDALGVEMATIRRIARAIGVDHALAEALWAHGLYEGRLVAVHVASPRTLRTETMDAWCGDIDSWELCDTACLQLFHRTPLAWSRSEAWTRDARPLVRRAGYALAGAIALHVERAQDGGFCTILNRIVTSALDEPPVVRNVIGPTLSRIGRRNAHLHRRALASARLLADSESIPNAWVGQHALAELESVRLRGGLVRASARTRSGSRRRITPAYR